MKIDYLQINSRFKNLDQIRINFDEKQLMTVVVGLNGSGKSNVIEALVSIFRNLDIGESPKFAYEIKYKLGEGTSEVWIKVIADPHWGNTPPKQYQIHCCHKMEKNLFGELDWQDISLSKVARDKAGLAPYLPRHVFAYYSGPSNRLKDYFKKHQTDFYRRLLRNELKLEGEIRPLFYAQPIHSQYVLLAFFLGPSDSDELKFLKNNLGIEGLDSIHFILRRPDWTRANKREELFWGAGGVVRKFLERIFPYTLAPIKVTRNEDLSLTGVNIKNEFFHLFIPTIDELYKIAGSLTPDTFFKMCESLLLSQIVADVRIRVNVKNVDHPLSFSELSEGEQQLLIVLGLLKFTGGKDTLFLLDEPDTHLNPAWDIKYLQFLRDFVPNQNTSHIIMITHNPLAIAELPKEQVQIMQKDETSQVYANEPDEDPRGMGFEGVLMSDMFGLKSPLDLPTQQLLDEKLALLAKDDLSLSEQKKLKRIDSKLSSYGMNYASGDPLYTKYLKEMAEQTRYSFKPKEIILTKTQRQELDEITKKIITEIKSDSKEGKSHDQS